MYVLSIPKIGESKKYWPLFEISMTDIEK